MTPRPNDPMTPRPHDPHDPMTPGYVSWGEYPMNFAAVLDQEEIYRLILAKGGNFDLQVSGSTSFFKLVNIAKLDMLDMLDKLDKLDKLNKLDKLDKLDNLNKLDKPNSGPTGLVFPGHERLHGDTHHGGLRQG